MSRDRAWDTRRWRLRGRDLADASTHARHQEVITQRFDKTADEATWSQKLLPAASFGLGETPPDSWKQVIEDPNGFAYTLPDVDAAAGEALKAGMVRYIIHQKPHVMPRFLDLGDDEAGAGGG